MDYTAGKGTTALSIIGTVLGGVAVAGGGVLNALNGGRQPMPAEAMCSDNMPVSRYDAALAAENAQLKAEKMLLESTIHTDNKSLEMYKYIDGELKEIRGVLCNQAVHNQKTEDSFKLVRQDLMAVKNELAGAIAMEAERRCCADNSIVGYVNATFYPKLVADVTAGTTTTAQATYNPIPKCGGCCNNG